MIYNQDTAFFNAIKIGDNNQIDLSLNKKIHLDIKNDFGDTPLLLATAYGYKSMVEKLLKAGANPNISGSWGETPLLLAAQKGDTAITLLLLEYDAHIESVNYWGNTPFLVAAQKNHKEIVAILKQKKADLNIKDNLGNNALLIASKHNQKRIVKQLLTYGIDPNSSNDSKHTSLLIATEEGFSSIVEILLNHGADPNLCDASEWTPLLAACSTGNLEIAERLLKHKAACNTPTKEGTTPLWVASFLGSKKMVSLLLRYKANPNIIDIDGYTPLLLAAEREHLDIVRYLLEEKAELYAKVIYSLRISRFYPWHNLPLWLMALTRGFPTRWQQKDDLDAIADPSIQTQVKDIRTRIEQEVLHCFPNNWFNITHPSEFLTYVPDLLRVFPQVIDTIQIAETLLTQNRLLKKEKWCHVPYPGTSVEVLQLLLAARSMSDSAHQAFVKKYGREPQRKPFCRLPNEILIMIHQQLLCMTLVKCLWDTIKKERDYIRICGTIMPEPTYFEQDREVFLHLQSTQPGHYELFKQLGYRLSQRQGVF